MKPSPALLISLALIASQATAAVTPSPAPVGRSGLEFGRLVPGFVAETRTSYGFPLGTGFAGENHWGQYTAYLMLVDKHGRRTWRIEHNILVRGTGTAQGSTIYLLEGGKRALLIDTGNPAQATEGVNDLKTVVRWLLGHENAGKPKPKPLDFVVANTHNHADHIGENARMSDRTVYYMDGDWPARDAPANYVPVKEGGGATAHGSGKAVGEIDLGGRQLKAIDVPPHSNGSIAWLDADNQLIFTGDAIGSSWPYLQRGPLTRAIETLHHLLDVTKPYPDLVVLPAHFYQLGALGKTSSSRKQQMLDRRYIADMLDAITGVVNGEIAGTPFFSGVRDYWAVSGSAHFVYTLDNVARPGEVLPSSYRVAELPGGMPREWAGSTVHQLVTHVDAQTTKMHLIRDGAGNSLFLVTGSRRALLIGTGAGAPGLQKIVQRFAGNLPLDVALLDADPAQTGGLAQLQPAALYTGVGVPMQDARARVLANGESIDLGLDLSGRPLLLEGQSLSVPGKPSLTLLVNNDGLIFVGTALGALSPLTPLPVPEPMALQEALSDWLLRVGGRFHNLYATPSPAWYTDPVYIDQLRLVLNRAISGPITGQGAPTAGKLADEAGTSDVRITAELLPASAASILVPKSALRP